MESDPPMSFGAHMEELRLRILKSLGGVALAMAVSFYFYEPLAWLVTRPLAQAMGELGREPTVIIIDPKAPFLSMIKLTFLVGLFASAPWVAYQMWGFVSVGLRPHERREVRIFAPISYLLFAGGCVFGFTTLTPMLLRALAKYIDPRIVAPVYGFSEYLDFVILTTLLEGAMFQIPLLMTFLSRVGLVQPRIYSRWRRAAIMANVVLAGVLSPPDPVSMLLLAVPLLGLYELGVGISHWTGRPPAALA